MAYNRLQKLRDNIEAIRTAFRLDDERRPPDSAEWDTLSKYAGFGGLKCILLPAEDLSDVAKWEKSDRPLFASTVELRRMIRDHSTDDREFARYMDSLKSSVLTAFYTPKHVVEAISQSLQRAGVSPKHFLDPSAGSGAFVDAFTWVDPRAEIMAFEKDLLTGKILSKLYPDAKVSIEGFEKIDRHFEGYFDVAASNIPFGDIAVPDPLFSTSREAAYRRASKSIHNYFFLKGLDCVREGGIMAFITSQGVMNTANPLVRIALMGKADLVCALRLPNNTFIDTANTEVCSDLIILQKNSGKKRLSHDEELFIQAVTDKENEAPNNKYFLENPQNIICTSAKLDTDPYGKPAFVYKHDGGMDGIFDDMGRALGDAFAANLNIGLYESGGHKVSELEVRSVKPDTTEKRHLKDIAQIEDAEEDISKLQTIKQDDTPPPASSAAPSQSAEIETSGELPPDYTHNPDPRVMMYNLFGELVEVPGAKKRRSKRQGLPQAQKAQPKPKKAEPEKAVEAKPEEQPLPGRLTDEELKFYGSLNWDDNPPINGFYETMMSIAHRQLAEREAARQKKQAEQMVQSAEQINDGKLHIEKTEGDFIPDATPTVEKTTVIPIEDDGPDMSPRHFSEDIQFFHKDGSLVVDNGQVGFLSDVSRFGATFTPLALKPEQEKRAMLYITLSETFQQLYHYEAETHEASEHLREHLNQYYDEFVDKYGNLNEKQNAKFILMDANGRDALALERGENGMFVKADIFDQPVAFAVDEVTSVDTPMEALSASLNKYGVVNLEYMGGLVDMDEDQLVESLEGHIYYNPLVENYEIADRFIAGNVVKKAEDIQAWIDRENDRIKGFPGYDGIEPYIEMAQDSLKALQDATPRKITFDELDFNFGERWIPTGIYSAYMSHLYGTNVTNVSSI